MANGKAIGYFSWPCAAILRSLFCCEIHPRMRVTLRQLKYFVAAAEQGSIVLASETISISQPSISAAIAHLEAEYKVQLFIRHQAHGLSLTPVGREFLISAKVILQQVDGLRHAVDDMSADLRGSLNVGCYRTFAPLIITDIVKKFDDDHPAVRVKIRELDQPQIVKALQNVEIELAVTYGVGLPSELIFEPLGKLAPYVLLNVGHRFANRGPLNLRDIASEPFILFDFPLAREYFMSFFLHEGISPNIVASSPSLEMVRSYVASGLGYSLAVARPRSDSALNGKTIAYCPLQGEHAPIAIGIASLRELRKTRAMTVFEDICRIMITRGLS
ncbi:MAG TPA: LysR substrate-binding domain-containing protein [Nordella sp.]|nr:LysR substrate-binding domain-containing protein [Nordella sp.]